MNPSQIAQLIVWREWGGGGIRLIGPLCKTSVTPCPGVTCPQDVYFPPMNAKCGARILIFLLRMSHAGALMGRMALGGGDRNFKRNQTALGLLAAG